MSEKEILADLKQKANNHKDSLQKFILKKLGLYVVAFIGYNDDINEERAGHWRELTGVIGLREDLLLKYKEQYINEVVSHEFAHALVSTMHKDAYSRKINQIQEHGEEFKRACEILEIQYTTSFPHNKNNNK